MCLILDTNLASLVFPKGGVPTDADFVPVVDWLYRKDGKLVFGGMNERELMKVGSAAVAIGELRRSGRAIQIPGVDDEQRKVEASGGYVSDDPHILALARKSGARTLVSHDEDLHRDFKDLRLVPRPRGMIYQDRRHVRMLRHTQGCRG